MERFRLRARQEPKRGMLWELHLFPERPSHDLKEGDARVLGSTAGPESIQWLRSIADTYLRRAEEPGPIAGSEFGPQSDPRWLRHEDGMRLALAFSAVRWLTKATQRRRFRDGLEALPGEVLLYWFVLCFYGYRQGAGRAALRTLLTHEEGNEAREFNSHPIPRTQQELEFELPLFALEAPDPSLPRIQEEDDDEHEEPAPEHVTSNGAAPPSPQAPCVPSTMSPKKRRGRKAVPSKQAEAPPPPATRKPKNVKPSARKTTPKKKASLGGKA